MQVWTSEETTCMYTVIVQSMARLEAKKSKTGNHKQREIRDESRSLGKTHMLSSKRKRKTTGQEWFEKFGAQLIPL